MAETTMVRLDAIRLPRSRLRCPVCGRVHGAGRWLTGAVVVVGILLALPVRQPALAGASDPRSAAGGHGRAAAEVVPDELVLQSPPPAAELTATAAPAALDIPDTALVWNREGTGVYVWDQPGGAIIGFVDNGLIVRLAERWDTAGGVPFGEVEYEGTVGWVDMRSVHRVVLPEGGFERLAAGGYLYDAPGGNAVAWLPEGTPVVFGQRQAGWLAAELVIGGARGWVVDPG